MAEPDQLKTVKLDTNEIREMAASGAGSSGAATHDGRFGEKFDDELDIRSAVWVTVSIAVVTALFFAISWGLMLYFSDQMEAGAAPKTPVIAENDERRLPSGPRLQASPEEELVEMRREMSERLHGYGWVDEAAGTVHVPVEKAMAMVLESGLAAHGPAAAEPAAEETAEQEDAAP